MLHASELSLDRRDSSLLPCHVSYNSPSMVWDEMITLIQNLALQMIIREVKNIIAGADFEYEYSSTAVVVRNHLL